MLPLKREQSTWNKHSLGKEGSADAEPDLEISLHAESKSPFEASEATNDAMDNRLAARGVGAC
jgi:hypothetical protein